MESPLKGVKIAETKELETLLGKTVKLYNKAIAEVGKGKRLTTAGETQYSKRKTAYSQYRTLAMQWANANSTEIGDQKILFDARRNTFVIIQSTKDDEGYIELKTGALLQLQEVLEDARESKKENYIVHEDIARYGDVGGGNAWNLLVSDERGRNGRVGGVYQSESDGDAATNYKRGGQDNQVKRSLRLTDKTDSNGRAIAESSDDIRYSRRIDKENGNVERSELSLKKRIKFFQRVEFL